MFDNEPKHPANGAAINLVPTVLSQPQERGCVVIIESDVTFYKLVPSLWTPFRSQRRVF